MQGLTLQQLQQMGATAVTSTPTQPTAQGYTLAQIQQMGGTPTQPQEQPGVISNTVDAVKNDLSGSNPANPLSKGIAATSEVFGAVGQLPVLKQIGEVFGKGINIAGDQLSKLTTPEFQKSLAGLSDEEYTKATQPLKDLQNLGTIANTILMAKGGAKAGEGVTNAAKTGVESIGNSLDTVTNAVKNKIAPDSQATIASRTTGLQQIADKYASASNALDAAKSKGFDPIADIASDDRFVPTVDTDGTIDASMSIKKLNDFVKPVAQAERAAIEAEGKSVSFAKFANDVRNSISGLKERGSSYDTISNKIESDLKVYQEHFVTDGKIDLTKLDDIKNTKYTISNWNNEDAQIADKTVARAARKTIIDNVSNADIDKLNKAMSQYYSARDFLDAIDGKKVAGGKLGKYFARVIGGTVGSHFGPLGALAGSYIGDHIQGGVMQDAINPYFGKKGNITPTPEVLKTTQETLAKPKLSLPGPISKVDK